MSPFFLTNTSIRPTYLLIAIQKRTAVCIYSVALLKAMSLTSRCFEDSMACPWPRGHVLDLEVLRGQHGVSLTSRPCPWPWGTSRTAWRVLGLGQRVLTATLRIWQNSSTALKCVPYSGQQVHRLSVLVFRSTTEKAADSELPDCHLMYIASRQRLWTSYNNVHRNLRTEAAWSLQED